MSTEAEISTPLQQMNVNEINDSNEIFVKSTNNNITEGKEDEDESTTTEPSDEEDKRDNVKNKDDIVKDQDNILPSNPEKEDANSLKKSTIEATYFESAISYAIAEHVLVVKSQIIEKDKIIENVNNTTKQEDDHHVVVNVNKYLKVDELDTTLPSSKESTTTIDNENDDCCITTNNLDKLEEIFNETTPSNDDILLEEEPEVEENNKQDNNDNNTPSWEKDLETNAALEMSAVFEEFIIYDADDASTSSSIIDDPNIPSNNIIVDLDEDEEEEEQISLSDGEISVSSSTLSSVISPSLGSDNDSDDEVIMNDNDGTFPSNVLNLDIVHEDDDYCSEKDDDDDDSDDSITETQIIDNKVANNNNINTNSLIDVVDDKENVGGNVVTLNRPPHVNNNNTNNEYPDYNNIIIPPNMTPLKIQHASSSPSMMPFPAILQMWEDRAASTTTNILDYLNDSHLSADISFVNQKQEHHPDIVSIREDDKHNVSLLTSCTASIDVNNNATVDDYVDNNDDNYNNKLIIVPDADMIVAMELIDDKPSQAEFELDCDTTETDDETCDQPIVPNMIENKSSSFSPTTISAKSTDSSSSIILANTPQSPVKKERFSRFRSTPSKKSLSSPAQHKSTSSLSKEQSPITPTSTKQKKQYQTPNMDKIVCSGTISTRLSLRSILTKKWHTDNYWMQYSPTCILIFRNHEDFHQWLHNSYLNRKQRDYLVRIRVDFLEEMVGKSGVRGFKLTDVKAKSYKKGPIMYNFKLEKWTDLGQTLYGAFASIEKHSITKFRSSLQSCLHKCPDNGLRSISDLVVS